MEGGQPSTPNPLSWTLECNISGRYPMDFQKFSFGSIRIDGIAYNHDVVIDRGEVRRRKKKPSKEFRDAFGHTPVSPQEGGHTLEAPHARDRHWNRRITSNGRSEARSQAPEDQTL